MAEIRFSCEKCGQQIVADAAAAGLRAECPSCRQPLIIPEPDAPGVISSGGTDPSLLEAQLELAYVREQLEAANDQCQRLHANAARLHAQVRSYQSERFSLIHEIEQASHQLHAPQQSVAVSGDAPPESVRNVLPLAPAAPLARQAESGVSVEEFAAMQKRLDQIQGELDQSRARLVYSENTGRSLAETCEELKSENARLQADLEELVNGGVVATLRAQLALSQENFRLLEVQKKNESLVADSLREDNATLRGIVVRQNSVLEERFVQIQRLQRVRWGLRLLYALCFLALTLLGVVALEVLPVIHLF